MPIDSERSSLRVQRKKLCLMALLNSVCCCMDTDVGLIRKAGRSANRHFAHRHFDPLCVRRLARFLSARHLVPHVEQRWATALFLGVALSISTIKIVAMVVHEMNFMRRDLGQIIVASAIIDDFIGWIIVAVVFGIARGGSIPIQREFGVCIEAAEQVLFRHGPCHGVAFGASVAMITIGIDGCLREDRRRPGALQDQSRAVLLGPHEVDRPAPHEMHNTDWVVEVKDRMRRRRTRIRGPAIPEEVNLVPRT